MQWKTFQKGGVYTGKYEDIYDRPAIVIYPSGDVAITLPAIEAIGKPSFVEFVSDGKWFGFRPAASGATGYKVQYYKKSKMPRISCKSAMEANSIPVPGFTKTFIGEMVLGAMAFDSSKPLRITKHDSVPGSGNWSRV